MTSLIIIAIVLLFGVCVYIESNYRHAINKTAREMNKSAQSSKYYHWGIDITVGFLLTIGKWLGTAICIFTVFGLVLGLEEIEPILYENYKILWWILAAVINIGLLWYCYLATLIKRSKQINFENQKHRLGFKFASKNPLIFTLWILFLMIVPYVAMHITHDAIWPFSYTISPVQYENNNTIMSQILQEVANTNAAVRSEVRYFADRLYKTMLTGITSSTIVLGLLIFYRTRKSGKDEK